MNRILVAAGVVLALSRTGLPDESAMKRNLPDWLRYPLMFTKDSGRGELAGRKPGDIARLVDMPADNHARAFRLSTMWGGAMGVVGEGDLPR